MNALQKIMGTIVFFLLSTSAAVAQTDSKKLDELRAADAAWLKTYEAKDLDKAVAFCDEQGSLLWPNAPRATGKSAIAKTTASAFAIPGFKLEWHPEQAGVARSGELGYTTGTYTWTFKDSSGKPSSDKGKYLTVWKKQQDGSWKVLLDMFNTDIPLN
jgi:ketosteroid isomerase-like protein